MLEIETKKEKEFRTEAKRLGIDLVLLFGSRADDTNRKNSDFDIAYRSKRPLDLMGSNGILNLCINYIGSDNVHVLDLRIVKPLTLYEIMRNCKVLYAENMMDFYNLRAYAFRRFEDEAKPLYKIIFERFKKEYQT